MRFPAPEGATPIEDASGLLPEGILTYADLCAAEAENILAAMDTHLKRRKNPKRVWMTEAYIRQVHRDMFKEVWTWAGHYRISETNLGIPAYRIREEIAKLCQDVSFWNLQSDKPIPVLEQAVRIHHRLAQIHSFPNGNGRHARLVADIFLKSHNHPLPYWPSSDISAAGIARTEYLLALREADKGNFLSLLQSTKKFLITAK